VAETFTGNPFTDSFVADNTFIRTFDENIEDGELIWHRDRKDRVIKVIEGVNWKIQYDNHLPQTLEPGKWYYVKKEQYHRVHKGNGKLVIEIQE